MDKCKFCSNPETFGGFCSNQCAILWDMQEQGKFEIWLVKGNN